MSRKRVAVLISGRGSNMAALIDAAKSDSYPADIALVLSNRPDAGGLLIARAAAIPTEVIDHTQFGKDRADFVLAHLAKEGFKFCDLPLYPLGIIGRRAFQPERGVVIDDKLQRAVIGLANKRFAPRPQDQRPTRRHEGRG